MAKPSNAGKTTTLAKTDTAKTYETIDLPVFIPLAELQNQLYQQFFAPNHGRFYPCQGNDCDDMYKDLYVENPDITIDSNIVSFKMHLAGTTHLLFMHPGISENLNLTSKPEVLHDTLFFREVKMEASNMSLLMGITSMFFRTYIERKIQEKALYPFRPTLDSITRETKKQFPLKWNSAALMLNVKKVYLNKVRVISAPKQGILADFTADLILDNTPLLK